MPTTRRTPFWMPSSESRQKAPKRAGIAGVGAAAELDRKVVPPAVARVGQQVLDRPADRHHPHPLRIFLAENRADAVDAERLLEVDLEVENALPGGDPLADQGFDLFDLGRLETFVVGEVEAGLAFVDQRALLHHVVAQHVAQAQVQQVGGAVVGHRCGAAVPSSTESCASPPGSKRPARTLPRWSTVSCARWVSITSKHAPSPWRMVPRSPTWPPCSA